MKRRRNNKQKEIRIRVARDKRDMHMPQPTRMNARVTGRLRGGVASWIADGVSTSL